MPGNKNLTVAAVMQNGKWGIIDSNSKWLIQPEYEYYENATPWIKHGLCALSSGQTGKYGLMNLAEEWIIPPHYPDIYAFRNGFIELHGDNPSIREFYEKDGSKHVFKGVDGISGFSEGLFAAELKGHFGFVNASGQFVIDPVYRNAHDFSSGRAAVDTGEELDEKGDRIKLFGYIDNSGKMVIPPSFEYAFEFVGNYAVVSVNGHFGLIDKAGKIHIQPQYEFYDFQTTLMYGFLIASLPAGQLGLMGVNGKWIVEPRFSQFGEPGTSDVIAVKDHGLWGFLDFQTGAMLVTPQFEAAGVFNDDMAPVKTNGKYGYINKKGKWLVPPTFIDAAHFSQHLAAVRTRDGYGYINEAGAWIIRPQFEKAGNFTLAE